MLYGVSFIKSCLSKSDSFGLDLERKALILKYWTSLIFQLQSFLVEFRMLYNTFEADLAQEDSVSE